MKREECIKRIEFAFKVHPVVALLGPRQCGKTTLANHYTKRYAIPEKNYFDLENERDLARLEDPMLTLSQLSGLIVIDEIQKVPDLFPTLRVLVDKKSLDQRYLILGSASRDLIRQSSETLAGRIGYLELTPFTLGEVDIRSENCGSGEGTPFRILLRKKKSALNGEKHLFAPISKGIFQHLGSRSPQKTSAVFG
ncbi:MAG: hypothetical protein K940chlam9_01094 [Chlamydiae bacterium]|nr:hypothetical protein [Chlamydiota bacterium]